jgi:hypothetical protein
MTDRDEAFERLRASDPAASDQPDLSALRARVMDAVDAEGVVVSLASRRRFSAPMAVAAVLALTVATGSGVLAGRATAPTDLASLQSIPMIGQNDRQAMGPEIGVASDAMGKGGAAMMWPGWRTILEPTAAIANEAGTAKAYRFSNDGVDPMAIATVLSQLMEATGSVRVENGSISAGGMDGQSPSIWVADDAMVSFSAHSPARSPWYCVKNDTPTSSEGGTDSGTSAPDRGCEPEESKAPSERSAVSAVREAFTRLGLDLDTVRFSARTDGPNVNVQAMLVVDGRVLQSGWYADVAAKGIHNINGFASRLVALPDYEIVGARDAALRSQDPRWSIIGPNHIWDGDNGRVGIMNADDTVSSDGKGTQPPVRTVGGRPVLTVTVNTVTVNKATLGLTQHWLSDNQMVLLPAWEFEGTDGSRWSMLAVAEKYVDFVSSR